MRKAKAAFGDEPRGVIADAFECVPIALCIARDRVIKQCNEQMTKLFRYKPEEIIGKSLVILYPSHEEFKRRGVLTRHVMLRTGYFSAETILKRSDDSMFWARIAGRTLTPKSPLSCAVWYYQEIAHHSENYSRLSPREREIAAALLEGLTNKQIGLRLSLSHRTIEMHRARLMRKLNVANVNALAQALVSR
jgi:PAS domain S-box-containing protein